MKTYKLTVSMPNGNAFEDDVVAVSARGTEGSFAVMKDHVPFITAIVKSEFKIVLPDLTEKIAETSGGLFTVGKDKVTYLTSQFDFVESNEK